jgi:hypothetical protein
MICPACNTEFEPKVKTQKFCCLKCKNSVNNKKYQNFDTQKARGIARKLELVKRKGGKCENCGYDKNLAGLCFHHLDPSTKEFQIDARKCANSDMESLVKEANKCSLLCHNCHMEEHYPELTGIIT